MELLTVRRINLLESIKGIGQLHVLLVLSQNWILKCDRHSMTGRNFLFEERKRYHPFLQLKFYPLLPAKNSILIWLKWKRAKLVHSSCELYTVCLIAFKIIKGICVMYMLPQLKIKRAKLCEVHLISVSLFWFFWSHIRYTWVYYDPGYSVIHSLFFFFFLLTSYSYNLYLWNG